MKYRQLGRSGLRVSAIGLGTMTFGGQGADKPIGGLDVPDAQVIVDGALDAGVNLIDTADVYAGGQSEEVLGKVIAGRRDEIVLATKARFSRKAGPNEGGLSRGYLIRACEASLRRLGTDYIDLYQLHERDGSTPMEETLEALTTLVRQGKIRYIGCSNHSAWHVMKALGLSDSLRLERFASQQIYYSILDREVENELIPLSVDEGLGVLVWSPLAGGILSGKYRRGQSAPAGVRHVGPWNEPPVYDEDRMYTIVEAVVAAAEELGHTPAQVALAYLLAKPAVSSVVVGARNIEQLKDNLAAVDVELPGATLRQLDEVSARPLAYPYWHQRKSTGDRRSAGDRTLLG
jgi:aryl-alcohol dehydrogenase-like predicted oxidoreductase